MALASGHTIMRGSDLWYHLAAGRWILEHGAVPTTDPWSFTCYGRPWINHEWLSGVSFALWERAFGLPSLAIWKWGMLVALFLVLFRVLARLGGSEAAAFLAVLLAALTAEPFLDVRPHLYTLLGVVVLLDLTVKRLPSAWLPFLFLVWGNLHAGYFFGLMALPLLLAPTWGRRSMAIALACVAACMLNPYGWETIRAPLEYALHPTFRQIAEWRSPFEPGGILSPWFPWAVGLTAAALVARPAARAPGGLVLLVLLVLAMALRSRRFIALFGLVQGLVTTPALAAFLPRPPRGAALAAVALGAAMLIPLPRSTLGMLISEWTFPVDTCDFAVTNGLRGNVFNYYNWGGYLHARTAGGLRVFIDGRADTAYDAQTMGDYMKVQRRAPGWLELLEASPADFFLWPRSDHHAGLLLATGRWVRLYEDSVSVLLARKERAPAGLRPPPERSPWRRYTLALEARRQGDSEKAERLLREVLEERPDLLPAWGHLAAVRRQGTSP